MLLTITTKYSSVFYNGVTPAAPDGINASLEAKRNPGPTGEGVYDSATGIFTEYPDVS